MSVQEFFKYTLMMREADRKDREERERLRQEAREADDKLFRNLFMAAIMQGKDDTKLNVEGKK